MRRKNLSAVIELTEEEKRRLMSQIQAFYLDVRDEEIGIIEQQQLIDLFVDHLAPVIYNKALDDVHKWYRRQQENLESDFYLLYRDN